MPTNEKTLQEPEEPTWTEEIVYQERMDDLFDEMWEKQWDEVWEKYFREHGF